MYNSERGCESRIPAAELKKKNTLGKGKESRKGRGGEGGGYTSILIRDILHVLQVLPNNFCSLFIGISC